MLYCSCLCICLCIYLHCFYAWCFNTTPQASRLESLSTLVTFFLLYNYLIPISLYVTLEVQKYIGALYVAWDIKMVDPETGEAAQSRTSDLIEELGQIQHLFVYFNLPLPILLLLSISPNFFLLINNIRAWALTITPTITFLPQPLPLPNPNVNLMQVTKPAP